jgi:hypothetical protein
MAGNATADPERPITAIAAPLLPFCLDHPTLGDLTGERLISNRDRTAALLRFTRGAHGIDWGSRPFSFDRIIAIAANATKRRSEDTIAVYGLRLAAIVHSFRRPRR